MTWTTPGDVLARWLGGGEPVAEDPKLAVFIEDAEDAIRQIYPNIQANIDLNEIPVSRVQRVVARIVIRAYKTAYSPLSSYSQATGPFSTGGTYEQGTKKHIALTDEDIADLAPPAKPFAYGMTDLAPQARPATDGSWSLYRSWTN